MLSYIEAILDNGKSLGRFIYKKRDGAKIALRWGDIEIDKTPYKWDSDKGKWIKVTNKGVL